MTGFFLGNDPFPAGQQKHIPDFFRGVRLVPACLKTRTLNDLGNGSQRFQMQIPPVRRAEQEKDRMNIRGMGIEFHPLLIADNDQFKGLFAFHGQMRNRHHRSENSTGCVFPPDQQIRQSSARAGMLR